MATLNGVYSALVVDNRDPDGLGRVLVRVSSPTGVIADDLWARVATMMAGRNRGTWFVPEVGDEVLVAFEHGDLKEAYVIGALWNAKSRPPAESPADVKLIRSRSGITLRIRDDRNNNARRHVAFQWGCAVRHEDQQLGHQRQLFAGRGQYLVSLQFDLNTKLHDALRR